MFKRSVVAVATLIVAAPALAAELNINKASADKLQQLDGVGDVKSQAIVDYRQSEGSFQSVDELTEVDGIGDATLDKNRERITAKPVE
jgi:competence protein ComEA